MHELTHTDAHCAVSRKRQRSALTDCGRLTTRGRKGSSWRQRTGTCRGRRQLTAHTRAAESWAGRRGCRGMPPLPRGPPPSWDPSATGKGCRRPGKTQNWWPMSAPSAVCAPSRLRAPSQGLRGRGGSRHRRAALLRGRAAGLGLGRLPISGRIPANTRFARTCTSLALPGMSFTSLPRVATQRRNPDKTGPLGNNKNHLTGVMRAAKSQYGRLSVSFPTSRTRSFRITEVSTTDCGSRSMDS